MSLTQICQLCSVFDKKPSRCHDFGKINLQSLQWCIGLCVLTQPSSLGLEFKYKSQEVFSIPGFSIRRLFPDHITHVTFPVLFEYLCELAGIWIDFKVRLFFINFLLKQVGNWRGSYKIKWWKRHITTNERKCYSTSKPYILLNDGAKRNRLLYLKIMYTAIRKILHLHIFW